MNESTTPLQVQVAAAACDHYLVHHCCQTTRENIKIKDMSTWLEFFTSMFTKAIIKM
jgi:hypothetical protein